MKKTIHNYWKKTENFRSSMPDFFRNNVFAPLDDDPTKPKKIFIRADQRPSYEIQRIQNTL